MKRIILLLTVTMFGCATISDDTHKMLYGYVEQSSALKHELNKDILASAEKKKLIQYQKLNTDILDRINFTCYDNDLVPGYLRGSCLGYRYPVENNSIDISFSLADHFAKVGDKETARQIYRNILMSSTPYTPNSIVRRAEFGLEDLNR